MAYGQAKQREWSAPERGFIGYGEGNRENFPTTSTRHAFPAYFEFAASRFGAAGTEGRFSFVAPGDPVGGEGKNQEGGSGEERVCDLH